MNAINLGGWFRASKRYALAHKFITGTAVILIVVLGWWSYGKATSTTGETRYILGSASTSTVISTVSASGQVSASNQLDIKPKVSGEVVSVQVAAGARVKAGALLVQLDTTDAQKSVRDAKANLESAQLALDKLQKPATALTLTQAQNALSDSKDALTKLYSDADTHIVNAFLDLPDIVTSVQDILIGDDACGNSQWNLDCYTNAISQYDARALTYRNTANDDYVAAKKAYDATFTDYQSLGSSPDSGTIEKVLNETYKTVSATSKAVKSANAFIQLYEDVLKGKNLTPVASATTALTNLNVYTGKLNTHLSTLLADTNSLKQDKQDIVEKQQSLDQTTAGADALDIKSQQLAVTKAANALTDAQNALANYSVRAPFDGTLAALSVKKFDTAGSGSAVATLITQQKIATLSLNEVDAAKVLVDDKATLTFDAIEGLSLTGKVIEIDPVGTVSQGVVSYTVKIGFDSQDDRVKAGMTVNAAIQTAVHADVLTVPSSAVKTLNGTSFVQVFNPPLPLSPSGSNQQGVMTTLAPTAVQVETGISDDTNVEIVSGLAAGEQIVVRSVTGTATASTGARTTTTGGARGGGFGGGGGNAVFIGR
jgi:RND family efflux transporter MFP subunit